MRSWQYGRLNANEDTVVMESNPGVVIRPARIDEIELAGRLRSMMAGEEGLPWDEAHPGWQTRFSAYFRAKQERGDAQLWYADLSSQIVGMGSFSVLDEYRAAVFARTGGWVNSVFVIPQYRRHGIGRALMQAGIDWLRGRGCVVVRLRTSDGGRPLYEALGFAPGNEMELQL
jgi:GNAT superfamily N-acetyltransferase